MACQRSPAILVNAESIFRQQHFICAGHQIRLNGDIVYSHIRMIIIKRKPQKTIKYNKTGSSNLRLYP